MAGLIAAGWTNIATPASDVGTFTGIPANTSTITLDSSTNAVTYTFVSVISGNTAFEVLINGEAGSIANLVACINGGPGGGTAYGNGTGYHAHNTITATGTSTTITASYIVGGSAGNGAAATTAGSSNMTWATSTLLGGGNTLLSAITPQGLQCSVLMYTTSGSFYNQGTKLHCYPQSRDGARQGPDLCQNAAAGSSTSWTVICNKYQFISFQNGTANTTFTGNGMAVFQPSIPSSMTCPTITAATNASPIVCTVANHGFTTGQDVFIMGGTGNTAVNVTSTAITVTDANTFSINGTTGNGVYTGGALCCNLTIGQTIIEAICASGTAAGAPGNFRSVVNPTGTPLWQTTNAQSLSNEATAGLAPNIFAPSASQWYDNSYILFEPLIGWKSGTSPSQPILGQMFDVVALKNDSISLDQTATFDSPSHNFWTVVIDSTAVVALLFATS